MHSDFETFVPCPNYPGYSINLLGNVKGLKGKILTPRKGRKYIAIANGFDRIEPGREVLAAFLGEFDEDLVVRYRDGNELNPALDNVWLGPALCPRGHEIVGANKEPDGNRGGYRCRACTLGHNRKYGSADTDSDEIYDRLMTTGLTERGEFMREAERCLMGHVLPKVHQGECRGCVTDSRASRNQREVSPWGEEKAVAK